jgi:hypothetical protein
LPATGDHTSDTMASTTYTSAAVSSFASRTRTALPTVTAVTASCTRSSLLATETVSHSATGSNTAAVNP